MFSVAPNILLAPNMTQNAERKHRTQDANTAHFRSSFYLFYILFKIQAKMCKNDFLCVIQFESILIQFECIQYCDAEFCMV